MAGYPGLRRIGSDQIELGSTDDGSGQAGFLRFPVQQLGTSQVSTNLHANGVNMIVASTTAPTYTLPAPTYKGQVCWVQVVQNTSSGSAVIATDSTGVGVSSTNANQVTISDLTGVMFAATTDAANWRVAMSGTAVSFGTQST